MDASSAESLLARAEGAAPGFTGPDAKASLAQIADASDDLLAAIEWFVDAGRTDDALRLANALYRFWITQQRFAEGALWFDRVLASPGGDERASRPGPAQRRVHAVLDGRRRPSVGALRCRRSTPAAGWRIQR